MIPIALVTGFLGSGKTALLQHLTRTLRDRRIIYLVNEFSAVDVDGHVLAEDTRDVVELPGGSVFCRCLVTDFIQTLTDIPERFGADGSVDGVVIEASGVANPRVVARMLRETRLDALYALSTIVTVIDPGTFPLLLKALPNIRAQVDAGDVAVINKTDLYDAQTIEQAEALVREIRPEITCVRAVRGKVDLPVFGPAPERALDGEYAPCADPNFARMVIHPRGEVAIEALRRKLEDARDIVYRLKGFVRADGRWMHVDYSAAAFTARPLEREAERADLVLIGRGDAGAELQALADALRGDA